MTHRLDLGMKEYATWVRFSSDTLPTLGVPGAKLVGATGEPDRPLPKPDWPPAIDSVIVRAAIHPAIGICRIGDSIFSALHAGMTVARAIPAALDGSDAPLQAYAGALVEIRRLYRARLRAHYAGERRWPEAPFWRERTPR